MSEQNRAVVRRLFEETDRREKADPEMFAPGFTAHIAGHPPMTHEAFEQFLGMFYAAFSEFSHTFEDMLAEGDRVAFRAVARAVHTGDFMGIPATGKQVSVVQIGFARVTAGKVAELWNSPDQLGLMQQLGLVPPS